jgi:hypothetical protein
MTKARPKKTADLVKLSTGVEVPPVFKRDQPIGDPAVGWWSATIDCTSGEPALVEFTIKALRDHPIPAKELTLDDVNRFIDFAIRLEAEHVKLRQLQGDAPMIASAEWVAMFPETANDPGVVIFDDEVLHEVGRRAVQASRDARNQGGRPPTPDEQKLAVLDAYERHGIDAAMKISKAKERWTRELVKQAKELRNQTKGER